LIKIKKKFYLALLLFNNSFSERNMLNTEQERQYFGKTQEDMAAAKNYYKWIIEKIQSTISLNRVYLKGEKLCNLT